MKLKKIIIFVLVLVLLNESYVLFNKYILGNCRMVDVDKYHGRDSRVEKCEGVLAVVDYNLSISNTKYIIFDDKHDYVVSGVDSLEEYKVINDVMYVKDRNPYSDNYVNLQYVHNDAYIQKKINNIKDYPFYKSVDIYTGETKLYKDFSEMPDDVRSVFVKLENGKK